GSADATRLRAQLTSDTSPASRHNLCTRGPPTDRPAPPSPMQHRTSQPDLLHPDLLMRSRHTDLELFRAAWPRQQPDQRERIPCDQIHERPKQAALLDQRQETSNLTAGRVARTADEFANPTRSAPLRRERADSLRR